MSSYQVGDSIPLPSLKWEYGNGRAFFLSLLCFNCIGHPSCPDVLPDVLVLDVYRELKGFHQMLRFIYYKTIRIQS